MIFQFSGYQAYLQAYLKQLPREGYGEARKIAEHLRVSSTFVSHALSGQKQLTFEQASLLSEYLGLDALESEYFYYLVQLERAGNHQLRSFCERRLAELKQESLKLSERVEFKRTLSDEEKAVFYSNALYSAIHLFTSTSDRGRSADEIAQRFDLTRAQAAKFLKFLSDTGLCEENDGQFKMTTQSTHVGSGSPHLLKHHTNWRLRAVQAGENLKADEMMYTVNVSLSLDDFARLREKMVVFIEEFLETVYASPAQEIACLNLDWFWIRG